MSPENFWPALALVAMLGAAGIYLIKPLWDMDYWWHIASGRVMWEHGQLLQTDPFGVYPVADPVRETGYLRSQWLGQVILYQIHDAFGTGGAIGLRVLTLGGCLVLTFARCLASSVSRRSASALLLAALAVLMTLGFSGVRPQLFSFLAAALLVVIIEASDRDRRWLLAVPALALGWANLHGGVVLGTALMGLWFLTRVAERRLSRAHLVWFGLATAGWVVATLITPNGAMTYVYVLALEGTELQARTSEYAGSFMLWSIGYPLTQAAIAATFLLVIPAVWALLRRRMFTAAGTTVALGIAAGLAYRYLPFFVFVAVPYVAHGLGLWLGEREWTPRPASLVPMITGLGALCACGVAVVAGGVSGAVPRGGVDERFVPVKAARVVAEAAGTGPAFTHISWGGYLLWRLDGRVVPFVDGRMLDTRKLAPYTHMLWATPEGIDWFRRAAFEWVIMPHRNRFSGEPYRLPAWLASRPQWTLVHRDETGVVYRRR